MEKISNLEYLMWCFGDVEFFKFAKTYFEYSRECENNRKRKLYSSNDGKTSPKKDYGHDDTKIYYSELRDRMDYDADRRIEYLVKQVKNEDNYPFAKVSLDEYYSFVASVLYCNAYSIQTYYNKAMNLLFEYNEKYYSFIKDGKVGSSYNREHRSDRSKDGRRIKNYLDSLLFHYEENSKNIEIHRLPIVKFSDNNCMDIRFKYVNESYLHMSIKLICYEDGKLMQLSNYAEEYRIKYEEGEKEILDGLRGNKIVFTPRTYSTIKRLVSEAGKRLIKYINKKGFEDLNYRYILVKNSELTPRFIEYIKSEEFGEDENKEMIDFGGYTDRCEVPGIYMYYEEKNNSYKNKAT